MSEKTRVVFNGRRQNFYEFFEVGEDVSEQELKAAYRKMCLRFHPDRHFGNPRAEENFKAIQAIWEVLKDYSKRSHYNHLLAIERGEFQQGPTVVLRAFFSGMQPSTTATTSPFGWGYQ